MYSIYKHTFPDGRVYIGCTSVRPELRYGRAGEGYARQRRLWVAIQECGWENVIHEVLSQTHSREEAGACEQAYIQQYDSTNPDKGYNTRSGGLGNPMGELPLGTGQRISEGKRGAVAVRKGNRVCYVKPDTLDDHLGSGWERGGRPCSEVQRQLLRERNLGKTLSETTKAKLSEQRTSLVCVHKDGVLARAKGARLEQLLQSGWERGMPARVIELNRQSHAGIKHSEESNLKRASSLKGKNVGKRQIHREGVRKMVASSDLQLYLQAGWELGTGPRKQS